MDIPKFELLDTVIVPSSIIGSDTLPDGSEMISSDYIFLYRPFNEVIIKFPNNETVYFKFDGEKTGRLTIGNLQNDMWFMYEFFVIDGWAHIRKMYAILINRNGSYELDVRDVPKDYLEKQGAFILDQFFMLIAGIFQIVVTAGIQNIYCTKRNAKIKTIERNKDVRTKNYKKVTIKTYELQADDVKNVSPSSIVKAQLCEFITPIWNTRGHYRKLKNGKLIWIHPHTNKRNKDLLSKRATVKQSVCILEKEVDS